MMCDGLNPQTGQRLAKYRRDDSRIALDLNFNSVKDVGLIREMAGAHNIGDDEVQQAHREAVRNVMLNFVEPDMGGRVRVDGRDDDRITGNMAAFRVTHRDTRVSGSDSRPDMGLHDHVVMFNVTHDPVEDKLKAAEMAQIKHDAPYYEAIYHNRLAHNLRGLGYGIERQGKAFSVAGVSRELVEKFSRRTAYINMVSDDLGITNPETKSKLGVTTRLGKSSETPDDLHAYWVGRMSRPERKSLASLKGRASHQCTEAEAVEYAIGHCFERRSVVDERRFYETAIRRGVGSVTPEGIEAKAKRQGVLSKDGMVTTRAVLSQEDRVVEYAAAGKGTCRGMGREPRGAAVPALERGYTRLYRAEATTKAVVADWIKEAAAANGQLEAQGRWFVEKIEMLDWYLQDIAGPAQVVFVAVPTRDLETYRVGNVTDKIAGRTAASFSRDPENEFFVPRSIADDRQPLTAKSRLDGLSPDQAAIARHVWESTDRVILIRGAAGTGKTHTMKVAIAGIDKPVVVVAPSSEASRGVLRRDGFDQADTLSRFLVDEKFAMGAKDGVVWVDEAGLVSMRQMDELFKAARALNARVVLQGDKRQHGSVERGATLRALEQFAGLPVAELTEIRRQRGNYKAAVEAISKGDFLGGYDIINELGWIHQTPAFEATPPVSEGSIRLYRGEGGHDPAKAFYYDSPMVGKWYTLDLTEAERYAKDNQGDVYYIDVARKDLMTLVSGASAPDRHFLVDDYLAAQKSAYQPGNHNKPLVDDYIAGLTAGKDMLVVAPTHVEGNEITAEIRKRLKESKVIDGENERLVETLVPTQWTNAQKGDPLQYDGSEVIQFHRNSAAFRAGDRVGAAALSNAARAPQAGHFSVYRAGTIGLAHGDRIKVTANGKDKSGRHRLDHGSRYTVAGFTKEGDLALTNGWTISKDFKHLAHAYVSTSHAAQGKTVDRVLIALGSESLPAISAETFYVSASRGRESARIYTSIVPTILRAAIQKSDPRMTASELMGRPEPKARPKKKPKAKEGFVRKVKQTYKWLRRGSEKIKKVLERFNPREMAHER